MLPYLPGQIRRDEPIASVTADDAHDARGCRDAVAGRGAEAVIPPRRNARPWKKDSPGAASRNETLRAIERLGRTIWRHRSGYHRRSRVETNPLGQWMGLVAQSLQGIHIASPAA